MRRSMKPCITTWPAYVPTLELDSPDASSATANASAAPPPSSRSKPACAPSIVSIPVLPALVEQRRGDDEHRQVDHAGEPHRDHDVDALEAQQRAPLGVVARRDPALHQRAVQVDDVRHHRRAEDADGEHHAVGPVEARHEAAEAARRVSTETCERS